MAKYHLTNKAVEDLSTIWVYTAEYWSESQADQYYNMLIGDCREIAESEHLLGTTYNEVMEGLRGYRQGKHIIFWQHLTNGDTLIVRILHQRMDLKTRLTEG